MGFTVTTNSYLRSLYKDNRTLSTKSGRSDASSQELVFNDTKALMRGIAVLGDEDYGDKEETDNKSDKSRFYLKMKSFSDAYNYTLSSSSDYVTKDTKKAVKQMKQLAKDYSDELEDLGITFDDDGYMSMSESAFDNIDEGYFEDSFGENSDFMKQLNSIARKLNRHIDYQA